ncbi:MAG TPA: SDR family NAD(P)-dependent oxidoreductase [Stellaceae bacterium]|nr:SDR family NAD(P)-dependent oxidoreductase [Stellaceae bacterium]
MDDLSGRVALVTGASRGIGRAVALALAAAGADVVVNYRRRAAEAEEVCGAIVRLGRRAIALGADVAVAAEVERLIAAAQAQLGTVDILVNNAGISQPVTLDGLSEAVWDETIAANLKSVFLVTQAVLPGMRRARWGRIINLSSTAAQIGGIIGPHYAASKAGIHGMTHAYASWLVREGITANVIAPALIETDMIRGHSQAKPDRIPVGRFGRVEEVAEVAVMLARNGYITGQTVNVNGGAYMS